MINYLSSYIPNMSEKTASLRMLLKDDTPWIWESSQDETFDDIKRALVTAPVLKLYDVKKPVTLQVDASQSGLGAVILQEGRPIAYASRALTEAETRGSFHQPS